MNRADKNNIPLETADASRCPLCHGLNDCRLCTSEAYKGPCWCETVKIPDDLLARVPVEMKHRACVCRSCVEASRPGATNDGQATRIAKLSQDEAVR